MLAVTVAGFGDGPDRAQVEAEARGQAAEADARFKASDFAAALPLYEAERTSRAALGDLRYEAYAARAIGCCQEQLGDLESAIASWKAAATLDAKREDRGFEGYDWFLIGKAELHREHREAAIKALERGLPLLSKAIDRDHECDTRLLLAHAWLEEDEPAKSLAHLSLALNLAHDLKDQKREADVLATWGRLELSRHNAGPAAEWLAQARALYAALALKTETATTDRLLGGALVELERPDAAQAYVERAVAEFEKFEDFGALSDACQFLATIRAEAKDFPHALAFAKRALGAAHADGDPEIEIDSLITLAHIEGLSNLWPAAASTLDKALKMANAQATGDELVHLELLAADIAHHTKDRRSLDLHLKNAETIARREASDALLQQVAETRQRTR